MPIVSFSQLRCINRCTYRWGLQYRRRIYSKSTPEVFILGGLIHAALAQYYAYEFVEWDALVSDYGKPISQESLATAKRTMDAYLDTGAAAYPGRVVGVEYPFQVPLDPPQNNHILVGWVDCIEKRDGAFWLWDHKTTSRTPNAPDAHAIYQLNAYAWALTQLGLAVEGVGVNYLVCLKTPKFMRFPMPCTDLDEWGKRLIANARLLPPADADPSYFPRTTVRDCDWDCDYKDICRLHLEGRMDAVALAVQKDFGVSTPGGDDAYLEQYHPYIPSWWLNDDQAPSGQGSLPA